MGAIGDWIGGMLCEEGDTECTEMWSNGVTGLYMAS